MNATADLFYFFDNLVLADQSAFEFQVSELGNPCVDTFSLQVPYYDTIEYQWYRNGIAIQGATEAKLSPVGESGNYQVRLTSPEGCKVTGDFLFERPFSFEKQERIICAEDSYQFQSQTLQESGTYFDTLKSVYHCDSIIQLDLQVLTTPVDSIAVKIFLGETYKAGSYEFAEAGEHLAYLKTPTDCDSLLHIDLDFYQVYIPNAFSPNDDGVNDTFTIFGDQDLVMIKSLRIFNRWGGLVFIGEEQLPNDASNAWNGNTGSGPSPNGIYIYTMSLLMADGVLRNRKGAITLMR